MAPPTRSATRIAATTRAIRPQRRGGLRSGTTMRSWSDESASCSRSARGSGPPLPRADLVLRCIRSRSTFFEHPPIGAVVVALAPGARIDPARRFAAGVGGEPHGIQSLGPGERRDRIEQVPAGTAATRRFDHVQAEEREDQVALRPQDLGPIGEPDGLAVVAGREERPCPWIVEEQVGGRAGRPAAASTAANTSTSSRARIRTSAMVTRHGTVVGGCWSHHVYDGAGASRSTGRPPIVPAMFATARGARVDQVIVSVRGRSPRP